MTHRLMVVPTGHGVGVTSVGLGMVRAFQRLGVPVGFYKPVATRDQEIDRSVALVRLTTALDPPDPIGRAEVERMLGEGDEARLLEGVVEGVERASVGAHAVVIEGLVPHAEVVYASRLNIAIAKAVAAELVFVAAPKTMDPVKIADNIDIVARTFGDASGQHRSCILNRVAIEAGDDAEYRRALAAEGLHALGVVPYREQLTHPRMKELAAQLDARVIHRGDWMERRIRQVSLCAAQVRYSQRALRPGTLIITPGDRDDIVLAACLASLRGTKLAGLLLCGGRLPAAGVLELAEPALQAGLPVFAMDPNSYDTAAAVHDMSREVPRDDHARAVLVMDTIADHLDGPWLQELAASAPTQRMTTPAFRHKLVALAREAARTVVLPEGDEPRTIAAAAICANRGIAEPVLLGEPTAVRAVAQREGVELPDGVRIVDPVSVADRYVADMVRLREHKGLNAAMARDQLEDTVVLGTMMLEQGDVHGLVSGAVHTTANTIRPALQLIRTAPGNSLVSSVFFMCLPDQVLVYGDCAVNPQPSAEQLAEIALQSADSAAAFGIEPRVAMISYATGSSGSGEDVEKVARATALAKERRPDLLLDGPLQYDAAAISDVAKKKAPGSPVAGRATVFIFPDLNTGNTTYKAVQRSANVVSMGPMLQGLAKPVNDLSRGALVEDIVFTIALTAIQSVGIKTATS